MRKVEKAAKGVLASALLAATATVSVMNPEPRETGEVLATAGATDALPERAPAPSVQAVARDIEKRLSAYLVAAARIPIPVERSRAPKIEPEPVLDRDPVCNQALNQALRRAGFVGVARETERSKDTRGFGRILRGKIAINGHCYDFASGGRNRGSIPPARYAVGRAEHHPYLHGKAYALSDVFDPFVKGMRDGLFVHVGMRSSGCIAIAPHQYKNFVADMTAVTPTSFDLVLFRPTEASS